jgi:hypothetical protein
MPFAIITLLHFFLLLWIKLAWKLDSNCKFVFTPFLVYIFVDIVFSWNYWLLFQDLDVIVSYHSVIMSMMAIFFFVTGYISGITYHQAKPGGAFPSRRLRIYLEQPISLHNNRSDYLAVILFLLLIFGTSLGIVYFRGLPPTIKAIAGLHGAASLTEAQSIVSSGRKEITKSHVFGGGYRGQGVLKNFIFVIWTYGLTLSLLMTTAERKIFWALCTVLFLIGCFFFVGGTGERSRLVWSLVVGLIGLSYVIKFDLKRMVFIGVGLFLVILVVSVLLPRFAVSKSKGELLLNLAGSVAHRISMGDKINNVRVMNLINEGSLHHLYGQEHINVALNTLPGVHKPPLSYRLASFINPGRTTYFSGTYLGTVYIDFGLIGIVIIYFGLGVFLQIGSYNILKLRKRVDSVVFIAFLAYALGNMTARAGIITFVSNVIPVVVTHLAVLFATKVIAGSILPKMWNRSWI